MEAIGIGGEENAGKRLTVLRAIDKLDRLGIEGVQMLLGPGRKDESGDFTKGAGLNEQQINVVSRLTAANRPDMKLDANDPNVIDSIERIGHSRDRQNWWNLDWWRHDLDFFLTENGFPLPDVILHAFDNLFEIDELLWNSGYNSDRVKIDLSVVRGLEYYTGPVYEVELLLDTKDEAGRPVRFGSVGGGGRYDGLVSRFRGEPVPATGFSIGVSRLQAALTLLGKLDNKPEPGPVVVTVFDRDRIADYQRMVSKLREAGIRAEMYLGSGKFGPQMKYADKRNSPCVVIQGGDEKLKNEIQIKDLILGATLAAIKDRDEYLKQQAEAQFAVPEDKLIDAVRQVLARHGIAGG
jgi:histidyl-tRNA synthetase